MKKKVMIRKALRKLKQIPSNVNPPRRSALLHLIVPPVIGSPASIRNPGERFLDQLRDTSGNAHIVKSLDTAPRSVRTTPQEFVLWLAGLGDQRFERLVLPRLQHLVAHPWHLDVAGAKCRLDQRGQLTRLSAIPTLDCGERREADELRGRQPPIPGKRPDALPLRIEKPDRMRRACSPCRFRPQYRAGFYSFHASFHRGFKLAAVFSMHFGPCPGGTRVALSHDSPGKIPGAGLHRGSGRHPSTVPSPVRRDKAPFPSGCESRPATVAPAGSNRSGW